MAQIFVQSPTLIVEDAGTPVTTGAKKLNFAGSGVVITEPVPDEVTVTIDATAGTIELQEEGAPIPNAPHAAINFIGSGVTAADGGGGTATVTIAAGSAPIDTVFGRTGTVTAQPSDYDASQVDNDSGVAGATVAAALDQLDADIAAGSTLESAVNAPSPDNDIIVPSANPVVFRDNAVAALTPLTITKTNSVNSSPAIKVEYNNTGGGIDVESTQALTRVTSGGIRFSGDKTTGGYSIQPDAPATAKPGLIVSVSGGNAGPGGNDDGGDLLLYAGAENGSGTAGKVTIGVSANQTSLVELGALGVPVDVLDDLSVTGDIAVTGTVDTVDVAQLKTDFDDHSDNHINGGTDELTAQLLGSGAEAAGRLMFTDGAGGWNVADESSIDHDQLTNFVAAEHIDWSASGAEQIDASRYSSGTGGATNTVAGTSPIENTGDNTNAVLALESQAEATLLGRALGAGLGVPGVLDATQARALLEVEQNAAADQTAGEIEAIVSHDNLVDFVANEHIDWTTDQGATNIDVGNVPAATTTTIGLVELATNGEGAAGVVVQGDDARLADARTPVAHNQAYTTINAVPQDRILGRNDAGTGTAEALNGTEVRAVIQAPAMFIQAAQPTMVDGDFWIETTT